MVNIIDANLQFNSNYSKMKTVEGILLHHSGVTVLQTVETIHNYHKNKGWAGIGYHYYVRKDGSIYKGRPETMAGAHCPGVNSTSIGICAEGDFNTETMSDVQKQAIIDLIADIKSRHNITYIKGHRDILATSCPGDNFPFDEIVNRTASNSTQETPAETNDNNNTDIFNDGLVNCIYDIQEWLNRHYNTGLALDNMYGPKTKSALIKGLQTELNTQFKKGLVVDGIWGNKTYNACINVRQGAKGNITMLIQMALFVKGYKLAMDKDFESDTEAKVKEFQKANGLSVDGVVGKNTFKKLFE